MTPTISERLITRLLKELNLDTKQYRPAPVASAISRAKNELITPASYRAAHLLA